MSTKKLVRRLCAMAEDEGCTVRWADSKVGRHIRLTIRDAHGCDHTVTVGSSPASLDGAVVRARAELRASRRARHGSLAGANA